VVTRATLFPGGAELSPSRVGWKSFNLTRLPAHLAAPESVCITVDALREALGESRLVYLERFFDDLRATVGCFLLSSVEELSGVMCGVGLEGIRRAELKACLELTLGTLDGRRFVVRSSAAHEDMPRSSFAGVYRSYLGLTGFQAICDAIAACWRAYYGYPAVAARVRAGDFSAAPELALLVQEMIQARYAGVAFSAAPAGGGPLIEYVEGGGEGLVSGREAAMHYRPGAERPPAGPAGRALAEVAAAVPAIAAAFGVDVDVEWAHDGGRLFILQVRPLAPDRAPGAAASAGAAPADAAAVGAPYLEVAELYRDTGIPKRLDLGECRDIYDAYVTKRASPYRLAEREGVATGAAHVVCFNAAGLQERRGELEAVLASSPALEAVVDVANNIRQVIVAKGELSQFLLSTFAPGAAAGAQRHAVIVRDYIRGRYGFISQLIDPCGLLVELSREGLMSVNRGTAACSRIVVNDVGRPLEGLNLIWDGDPDAVGDFVPVLPRVLAVTSALAQELGNVQLEWALADSTPYFIDYSRGAAASGAGGAAAVVVSAGVARGPAFFIGGGDVLERLSIGAAVSVNKYDQTREHAVLRQLLAEIGACERSAGRPVVFVRRPYAILSALLGHVAGFVFGGGGLLCHLAIMLREHGVPALICERGVAEVQSSGGAGRQALICDGELTLL
jgi:hypothetical protein